MIVFLKKIRKYILMHLLIVIFFLVFVFFINENYFSDNIFLKEASSFQKENLPSVKILVGYHKKTKNILKDNDILVPIHLGRDLKEEQIHSSKCCSQDKNIAANTPSDLDWLKENMIGDNTGENISKLNRGYCDLTGMYWAYKNFDELSNPDYIGFFHYRRHLSFGKYDPHFPIKKFQNNEVSTLYKNQINDTYKEKFGLKEENIKNIIKNYDVILPKPLQLYSSFRDCFSSSFMNKIFNIVKKNYSEYSEITDCLSSNQVMYQGNIFIMKKDIFKKFSKFIFDIIDKLSLEVNFNKDFPGAAYAAEVLINIFLAKEKVDNDIKCLELDKILVLDP